MKLIKKILIFIAIILLAQSCATTPQKTSSEKNIEKKPETTKIVKAGWSDPDTYIVRVIGPDIKTAEEKAKHKILKDIVNTRIMNNSPYTDITGIREEFKEPLQKGKIISSQELSEGVEIYYQITGKNLRMKFEQR